MGRTATLWPAGMRSAAAMPTATGDPGNSVVRAITTPSSGCSRMTGVAVMVEAPLTRNFSCGFAGRGHCLAGGTGHQAAVVGDRDEAEPDPDHSRSISCGAIVQSGKLAVLLAARQKLIVDAEDQRLF